LKTKGVEEYLENGVNGFILEKIDKEEIKRIILKNKLVINKKILNKFHWEKKIINLKKFYEKQNSLNS